MDPNTPGSERYSDAFAVSNTLRLAVGFTYACAHIRRESEKTFDEKVLNEWSLRVIRLHVLITRLKEEDLPTVLDLPASQVLYRLRLLSDAMREPWLSWISRTGPLTEDDERWLTEVVTEAKELGLKLLHAIEGSKAGSRFAHNEDFTWVRWCGIDFSFSVGQQAEAVRALWEEWEICNRAFGAGISQERLRDLVGSSAERFELRTVLRGHPAWQTMIRGSGRGAYALFALDAEG